MTGQIHFLLAPDASSARRARRSVAERGSRLNTIVGTWVELEARAGDSFLVPASKKGWDGRVEEAAAGMADAFWIKSYGIDPAGTMAEVRGMLSALLRGTPPGRELNDTTSPGISARGRRRFDDLVRLAGALNGELPEDLERIRRTLEAPASRRVRRIRVYRVDGLPAPDPWQRALLAKLDDGLEGALDPELQAALEGALFLSPPEGGSRALSRLQSSLFADSAGKTVLDDSLLWLGARDGLEEMEVAAGMVQRILDGDGGLVPAHFGLLLDGSRQRDRAAVEAFNRAGLPLSGLRSSLEEQNLGGEALFNFLVSRRPLAPVMSLAALVASPLMPWPTGSGMLLAGKLMEGDFSLRPADEALAGNGKMLDLLREKAETVARLSAMLETFLGMLNREGKLESHADGAREAAKKIQAWLADAQADAEPPWSDLLRMVPQAPTSLQDDSGFTREGITVFYENEEPWRGVRVLFVAGFSEGHYPVPARRSAVFDEVDLSALVAAGIEIETADSALKRSRELFLRQLRSASEKCVFLVPLRDDFGRPLAASSSAAFMARLFEGIEGPERLLLTLDRESDRSRVPSLALAPAAVPLPLEGAPDKDLELGRDLFQRTHGEPRRESPTRLEKLMVSPLAWLLDRLSALPRAWKPEECDPITKGNVAHKVFERLFAMGEAVPSDEVIVRDLPDLYARALQERAPFLNREEWSIERKKLEGDLEAAARAWGGILRAVGAEVIGTELDLVGTFSGLDIRGTTDLVLKLASGAVFVVDYKKSTVTKRLTSMKSGYDLQTSLYRLMIEGGAEPVACLAGNAGKVGVMYYLMDSRQGLTDMPFGHAAVRTIGVGISENAERELRERIAEIRKGLVRLNREGDGARFDKVGVYVFCLEDSPLILKYSLASEPVREEG